MTFWNIYTIICGPFWSAQEIHKRGMVEDNAKILNFKKRVERAEVDADIAIFQMQHGLNNLDHVILKGIADT